LAYFADAAEALDVIAAKFNLQHLDIKPANLFLVSGHVKVGDYGLVAQLEGPDARNRGLTPRYVAPEVLHGTPSMCSDQYSLALVYGELLTGVFPYTGRTPQQLMLQHVSGRPDLSALPPADQPAVAKALAKKPEERFASCLAFVQALMTAGANTAVPSAAMNLRRARVDRSVAELTPPPAGGSPDEGSVSSRADSTQPGQVPSPEPTQNFTLPSKVNLTVPGRGSGPLPPLVSGNIRPPAPSAETPPPSVRVTTPPPRQPPKTEPPPSARVTNPPPRQPPSSLPAVPLHRLSTGAIHFPPPAAGVDFNAAPAEEVEAGLVVLDHIASVMSVAGLLGRPSNEPLLDPQSFVAALVQAAASGAHLPQMPGDVGRLADGTWVCQFPSTVPPSVVPLKLSVMHEHWGVGIEQPDAARLVLRRAVGGGGFFGGKRYGYEVTVLLPSGNKPVGEVTALARVFGTTDAKFVREAQDVLPKMVQDVRAQLGNVPDRRRHPRVACGLGLTLYPIHSDGGVDAAVSVKCRDVSLGGVGFASTVSLQTKYAYATFADVPATAGQAILIRLMRVQNMVTERHYGAQYRTDL
jgi:hypothetical protein